MTSEDIKHQLIIIINCEGQSHKALTTNHNLFEEKGELKQNQAKALLLTSLTFYR